MPNTKFPFCKGARLLIIAFTACLAGCDAPPSMAGKVSVEWASDGASTQGVTLPMVRASGRWLVELTFVRPDGNGRRTLACVNMGAPAPVLSERLYRELGLDQGRNLAFKAGRLSVTIDGHTVADGPSRLDGQDLFSLLFQPREVEAILPAGVLDQFQNSIDPKAATLTLAPPGTLHPDGIAVPVRVHPDSGLAVVDTTIDGAPVPLVLDVGAPYTWMRGRTVADWFERHPDWHGANGTVGRSNLAMADLGLEREGRVGRIPEVGIGLLVLKQVGVLGPGPLGGSFGNALRGEIFWDTWQKGAGEPVIGWLGTNVLGDFKLTIDCAEGLSFWERQRPADPHDLDGIGLTLARQNSGYKVAAVVTSAGRPLVEGVSPADHLLRIDGQPLDGLPADAVLSLLAGYAGVKRRLDVDHEGILISIETEAASY